MKSQIVIKTYKGSNQSALAAFRRDANRMAAQGYVPTSQTWAQGTYGCADFLVALLLCVILIGIVVFIYMVIVKPSGTLTVTYELRGQPSITSPTESFDDTTVPEKKANPVVVIAGMICAVLVLVAVLIYACMPSAAPSSPAVSPNKQVASSPQTTTPAQANSVPAPSLPSTTTPPATSAANSETNFQTNGAPTSPQGGTAIAPVLVATDDPEAAAYRIKATAGDAEAAQQLGYLYLIGQGVPKDSAEAEKWIEFAADHGNATGEYNLGMLCYNGQGVVQDYTLALNWYKRAADQGLPVAQYCVGHMFENGQGVPKDVPAAMEWYKKADAQGQPNARDALKRLNAQN